MKRYLKRGAIAVAAILILLQLMPEQVTNPPVTREIKWDTPGTRALVQRACFDCHTNLTVWPWYSHVAPMSFLVVGHVTDGRARLNFTEWDRPNANFTSVNRNVTMGDMPIWNYVLLHPDARLTPEETQQLLAGLQATFQQDPPISRPSRAR
jgi:hypothetical protein